MNHELSKTPEDSDPFIKVLGVSPDSLRDPAVAEAYHAKMARAWADGEPHYIVDASTVSSDGFDIGYFDGKELTASIRFSYDNGANVECGAFTAEGVELGMATTLVKVLNHNLTPEGRDKLFPGEFTGSEETID